MLSIVIVNWNTRDLLRKCLASISSHPPHEEYEVIVVDNDSKDESANMVETEFPSAKLIRSGGNKGYAKGNNLGISAATGEFILTLNPDTEFVDDSLDRALHILRMNPQAGCLGAKQISPDGSRQLSIRGFPTVAGIFGDLSGLGKSMGGKLDSYRLTRFDYDQEQPAPQPMGTFLMFRRQALEEIGDVQNPYDESFPIFFNEVDLLYRLADKGWICIYAPSVRILHHGGESTKLVRKSMIWESHRSLVRFLRKHQRSALAGLGITLLAPIIYAAAFVRAKGYHAGFQG